MSLLKALFNGVLVLYYYFKKYFNLCFFILKAFCSTLNSRIGEFDFLCHEQGMNQKRIEKLYFLKLFEIGLFLYDLFLDARAEIIKKISLLFWSKRRH